MSCVINITTTSSAYHRRALTNYKLRLIGSRYIVSSKYSDVIPVYSIVIYTYVPGTRYLIVETSTRVANTVLDGTKEKQNLPFIVDCGTPVSARVCEYPPATV